MKPVEFYSNFERVSVRDNAAALDFIVGLGFYNQIAPEALAKPVGGKVDDTGAVATCRFYFAKGHETHWIVIYSFHGFIKESENGFMVNTWPKALYSEADVNRELDRMGVRDDVYFMRELPIAKTREN